MFADLLLPSCETSPIVYIVDQDEAVRHSFQLLLGIVAIETQTFASAEEFLATVDFGRPACLITEVDLPGLDGLELQACLREQRIAIPVIVTSRQSDVRTAVRAMQGGAVDFFEKPFVDRLLINCILDLLELPRRSP